MPLGAFCVEDRVRGIKTQQILMGVKRSTYWIGLFICDYAIAFFLVITAIIGLAAAQSPTLRHEVHRSAKGFDIMTWGRMMHGGIIHLHLIFVSFLPPTHVVQPLLRIDLLLLTKEFPL